MEQSPIINGNIKSREILSKEYTNFIKNNDMLKTMNIFGSDDYKQNNLDYNLSNLNYLKKLSLLENPTDFNKDKKEKKKGVKFYLNKNPSNIQQRMSIQKSAIEEEGTETEVESKKTSQEGK